MFFRNTLKINHRQLKTWSSMGKSMYIVTDQTRVAPSRKEWDRDVLILNLNFIFMDHYLFNIR
jgi:hypothetical protein